MKFMIDERVKHRLTGVVVLLALATIFLPMVLKKPNRHFEETSNLSVRLPAKPIPPKVAMADKNSMFHSVKVAHVVIPPVGNTPQPSQLVQAEPLNIKSSVPAAPLINQDMVANTAASKVTNKVANKVASKATLLATTEAAIESTAKEAVLQKEIYTVQLASFSRQDNAISLVTRLRSKGYVASYNKASGKLGDYYQVLVGQLNQKNQAKSLQKQLALSMQLHGVIVKKGIS